MRVYPGTFCRVFDSVMWRAADGDFHDGNNIFFMPATIARVYPGPQPSVDIVFHHDHRLSRGHYIEGIKEYV